MANAENITLGKARRNEIFWTIAGIIDTAGIIGGIIGIPEDSPLEAGMILLDAIILWERHHWAEQVRILEKGGSPTRRDISNFDQHHELARQRNEGRRARRGRSN